MQMHLFVLAVKVVFTVAKVRLDKNQVSIDFGVRLVACWK